MVNINYEYIRLAEFLKKCMKKAQNRVSLSLKLPLSYRALKQLEMAKLTFSF